MTTATVDKSSNMKRTLTMGNQTLDDTTQLGTTYNPCATQKEEDENSYSLSKDYRQTADKDLSAVKDRHYRRHSNSIGPCSQHQLPRMIVSQEGVDHNKM